MSTLYGRSWAVVVDDRTGTVEMHALSGSTWEQVPVPGHPVIGYSRPSGARRYSVAFDQAAHPVVAHEVPGGMVSVTRWDPFAQAYVQETPFPGVDPCLISDAAARVPLWDSDVLLFYLSPDRQSIYCRVQRDNYAVPEAIWEAEAQLILDRAQPIAAKYQLLLSDAAGRPLPYALVSALYPYHHQDAAFAQALGPTEGSAWSIVRRAGSAGSMAGTAHGPSGGGYREPVEHADGAGVVSAVALGPTAGAIYAPIVHTGAAGEVVGAADGPAGGSYLLVVAHLPAPDTNHLAGAASGPSGGAYYEET